MVIYQNLVYVAGAPQTTGQRGATSLGPGDGAGSLLAAAGPDPPWELGYPSPGTRRGLAARPGDEDFPFPRRRDSRPPRGHPQAGTLAVVSPRPDAPAGSQAGSSVSCRRLRPRSAAAPGPSGEAGALGLAGARGSRGGREGHGIRSQSRGPGSRR